MTEVLLNKYAYILVLYTFDFYVIGTIPNACLPAHSFIDSLQCYCQATRISEIVPFDLIDCDSFIDIFVINSDE